MTLAERLRNEGYQEGVQEAIDMGLSLRFPQAHQELMPLILRIQDLEKLKQIKAAIKTAKDISELRAVIEQ